MLPASESLPAYLHQFRDRVFCKTGSRACLFPGQPNCSRCKSSSCSTSSKLNAHKWVAESAECRAGRSFRFPAARPPLISRLCPFYLVGPRRRADEPRSRDRQLTSCVYSQKVLYIVDDIDTSRATLHNGWDNGNGEAEEALRAPVHTALPVCTRTSAIKLCQRFVRTSSRPMSIPAIPAGLGAAIACAGADAATTERFGGQHMGDNNAQKGHDIDNNRLGGASNSGLLRGCIRRLDSPGHIQGSPNKRREGRTDDRQV